MQLARQENPWYPFSSLDNYRLARDLSTPKLLSRDTIMRIGVKAAYMLDGTRFNSCNDFIEKLDEIMRCQSLWQQLYLYGKDNSIQHRWTRHIFYWRRDALAVLQEILENTALNGMCVWRPERTFNGDRERVYTDLHDSDWWWEIQVIDRH
jgi:hypothetical protein